MNNNDIYLSEVVKGAKKVVYEAMSTSTPNGQVRSCFSIHNEHELRL